MEEVAEDLGLNEDEVDEEDDKVMLDVFVGEAAAVLADGEAHAVVFVVGAGVLRVQRLDGVAAFDADGHGAGFAFRCCFELGHELRVLVIKCAWRNEEKVGGEAVVSLVLSRRID